VFLWKSRHTRRRAKFLLGYITSLICLETVFQISESRTVQMIYIDNRNYPGGPWAYFLATQDMPENVLFIASLFLLTFFADILLLWRCWVIWSAFGSHTAYLVIALPGVLLLSSLGMGVLWTVHSSIPGMSLYSMLPLRFGTTYYSISLTANVILTILIATRLLFYRRKAVESLPKDHATDYLSLVAIVVESASIHSAFALVFLVTYAVNHPINSVFLIVTSSSQQISNYLIIYRLAEGRAWDRGKMTRPCSTLKFGGLRPMDVIENVELGDDEGHAFGELV